MRLLTCAAMSLDVDTEATLVDNDVTAVSRLVVDVESISLKKRNCFLKAFLVNSGYKTYLASLCIAAHSISDNVNWTLSMSSG